MKGCEEKMRQRDEMEFGNTRRLVGWTDRWGLHWDGVLDFCHSDLG